MIDAGVRGDTEDPGAKRLRRAQAADLFVHLEPDFLTEVLGCTPVADAAEYEVEDSLPEDAVELAECGFVTLRRSCGERHKCLVFRRDRSKANVCISVNDREHDSRFESQLRTAFILST